MLINSVRHSKLQWCDLTLPTISHYRHIISHSRYSIRRFRHSIRHSGIYFRFGKYKLRRNTELLRFATLWDQTTEVFSWPGYFQCSTLFDVRYSFSIFRHAIRCSRHLIQYFDTHFRFSEYKNHEKHRVITELLREMKQLKSTVFQYPWFVKRDRNAIVCEKRKPSK